MTETSIWETCNEHDGTPFDDTILALLHTLNRGWLEVSAHLQLSRLALTILDFIDNPYHGDHYDEEGEICSMAPKDGTTTCHRYWTAYVVSNGKPVTLAMTYVRNDKTEADAIERAIRRSQEIAATVVHVPKEGDYMKERLDVHNSYMMTYRLSTDSEREVRVPLAVAVSYQNGDRNKHGEVVRVYVACGVTDHTTKQVERISPKR